MVIGNSVTVTRVSLYLCTPVWWLYTCFYRVERLCDYWSLVSHEEHAQKTDNKCSGIAVKPDGRTVRTNLWGQECIYICDNKIAIHWKIWHQRDSEFSHRQNAISPRAALLVGASLSLVAWVSAMTCSFRILSDVTLQIWHQVVSSFTTLQVLLHASRQSKERPVYSLLRFTTLIPTIGLYRCYQNCLLLAVVPTKLFVVAWQSR